ncbi:DUF433 domain-containing protein [Halorubrum sp. SP3]|nr:DUF433 domain-containing protein [Halorubrum sp. SP3]TKX55499.1 DUF433 domain-containing protein [Halorubrum sp. SP3]
MAQSSVRIATEVHDEPHIEGRRVTVRRIQGLVEGAGKSADEVADQLDLDVADMYGALQYYHSHPDGMAAVERQRADREAAAQEAGAVSLSELKGDEGAKPDGVSGPRRRGHESAGRGVTPGKGRRRGTRPRGAF